MKKAKPLFNFINSHINLKISWADFASIDWENSATPLNDLIGSISVINQQHPNQEESTTINPKQKLTLT